MGPKHSSSNKSSLTATNSNSQAQTQQHVPWISSPTTGSPISLISNLLSTDKKTDHSIHYNHRKKHILLRTIGLALDIPMDVIALIGMTLLSLTTGTVNFGVALLMNANFYVSFQLICCRWFFVCLFDPMLILQAAGILNIAALKSQSLTARRSLRYYCWRENRRKRMAVLFHFVS
jgi:hypothetical protein